SNEIFQRFWVRKVKEFTYKTLNFNLNAHISVLTKMGNIQMKYIIYKYTDGNTSYYIDEPGLGWKCWP
ncbi:hypothetical protein COA25_32090, partial [Bacillus cereus]|uniref:hypothetical protein n=1 Tax=Bacillus cereus TaxID=1396 RepID=UPI000C038899